MLNELPPLQTIQGPEAADARQVRWPGRWPLLASALAYVAITLIQGRDVLKGLSTHVVNDLGDPLLTAAILRWNATQIPLTDAWWQLPIFHPTRDALAFSEHLLGLSLIASPLSWLTGDTLATANIVTLLTFPLSALAMYALVFRLTRHAGAAFLAGLAFGFAPYRVSQIAHVQVLAVFWAPLALLGLHAFIDTGRRRWLVLYGVMWLLQAAASGYTLFFFSVLVGLWVVWFVVAQRRWRALAAIAASTIVGCLPLVPLLYTYLSVHAHHGFVRSVVEMRAFSADISAMLCAPARLTLWGWLRVNCRPEGELFPGVAMFGLALVGMARLLGGRAVVATSASKALTLTRWLLLTVAVVYGVVMLSVLIAGPWRVDAGFVRVSVSALRKPLLIWLGTLALALLLSPGVRAAFQRSTTLGFYLVAAVVTWLLALGPTFIFMGEPTGIPAPFSWLLLLPGADSLRVPARFWLMTMMCLSVAAGIVVADTLRARRVLFTRVSVALLACALLADGWVNRFPAVPVPDDVPDARALRGTAVLDLPLSEPRDTLAEYRAIVGGWRSVNGYSGYRPVYYPLLEQAIRFEVDDAFAPFQRGEPLSVLVMNDAPRLNRLVGRQPGAMVIARTARVTQYRLPADTPRRVEAPPEVVPVQSASSDCAAPLLPLAIDGNPASRWTCFSEDGTSQAVILDAGMPVQVSAVTYDLGADVTHVAAEIAVATSVDGTAWEPAPTRSVLSGAIEAGLEHPRSMRVTLPFPAREARYVRLTHPAGATSFSWSVAEIGLGNDRN